MRAAQMPSTPRWLPRDGHPGLTVDITHGDYDRMAHGEPPRGLASSGGAAAVHREGIHLGPPPHTEQQRAQAALGDYLRQQEKRSTASSSPRHAHTIDDHPILGPTHPHRRYDYAPRVASAHSLRPPPREYSPRATSPRTSYSPRGARSSPASYESPRYSSPPRYSSTPQSHSPRPSSPRPSSPHPSSLPSSPPPRPASAPKPSSSSPTAAASGPTAAASGPKTWTNPAAEAKRRILVTPHEVDQDGALGYPAGRYRESVSDHLTLGARVPSPMGYTPSMTGRQFHRRRARAETEEEDQPVGGRYNARYR